MLILATDTSGKHGSIALVRFNQTKALDRRGREERPQSSQRESSRALEVIPLQGGTFSAQLIPQIAELLSKHHLSKNDIDAFAVATGPGSFTGLRVGLAAIKALAEILHRAIAPVSLLEVIAFEARNGEANQNSTLLVAMDAGRNEAFVGEYKVGSELPCCVSESLLSLQELAGRMTAPMPIRTPDDNIAQFLTSQAGDSGSSNIRRVEHPNAISVARLGCKRILAGQTISPEALDATYIRRADAELAKPNRPT